jgi:hypothetical protein
MKLKMQCLSTPLEKLKPNLVLKQDGNPGVEWVWFRETRICCHSFGA